MAGQWRLDSRPFSGSGYEVKRDVDVGVAVDVPAGLLAIQRRGETKQQFRYGSDKAPWRGIGQYVLTIKSVEQGNQWCCKALHPPHDLRPFVPYSQCRKYIPTSTTGLVISEREALHSLMTDCNETTASQDVNEAWHVAVYALLFHSKLFEGSL